MKKFRRILSIFLASVCLAVSVASFSGCSKKLEYTIDVGDELPPADELVGVDGAVYVAGFDENFVNKPGKYTISAVAAGKNYQIELTIRDRKAPVVVPKHVYYAIGTDVEPRAEDFIAHIDEADTYEAYFVGEVPLLDTIGDHDISFKVKDASGNVSDLYSSVLTVIYDTQAPVFERVPELSAYVGEAIAYRQGLVVTDNCGGEIQINVDSSAVNPNLPGDYSVRFYAIDASGNSSWADTVIHIYNDQVTEEMLNRKIDEVISSIITFGMTKEQQCRAVYEYVQSSISYVSSSDKSDLVRAAYSSLFVSGTGDCFNYHAAAIAFVKRLGIEFKEIQRTAGQGEGTHYWCMVNIGTSSQPRWYHFDTTRLRADYDHSGCLLTDKQVNAYNKVRAGFYAYDSSNYPASADKIITPTPNLEPYY